MAERPYRIIYNWDGAPHHYDEHPQAMESFLRRVYAPLAGTQVDALFWCMGIHEATWLSEDLAVKGDSAGRVYDSVLVMRDVENLRSMLEGGEDPYAAMVARGRELGIDVWPSIRMNDQHFWNIQDLETMQRSTVNEMTALRKEHPRWCLGDQAPGWCATSWNMAVPEVRAHKLEMISQACRLADWDGVELDWQRHAFHLPANHEYRLRYAVRVAATLESCRRIGYDIETWVEEGLCDILIGGGNSGTDPCFETEEFLRLVEGTQIQVYPGFDFDTRQQADRLIPHGRWRDRWFAGMAQGHLDRGAHGIYVFNWHADETMRRESLTTIGSTETLRGLDKAYTAVHRSVGGNPLRKDAERDDRIYGEAPVDLHRTLTGDGPTFHLTTHDPGAAGVQLLIEMDHWSPTGDEVAVTLDGAALGPPEVRNHAAENPQVPADVDENSWLVWDLDPAQAASGAHEIQVVLVKRDPRIRPPLTVANVEIWTSFG